MTDPKIQRLSLAIAEALAALVDLANNGDTSSATMPAAERPTQDAPSAEPKTRTRKAASSTTVVEEPLIEEVIEVVEDEPATPAPTLETARALAVDLAKAKGRAGLLDVLTQFGAAGVSALIEDQIADFCDAVRESLAA